MHRAVVASLTLLVASCSSTPANDDSALPRDAEDGTTDAFGAAGHPARDVRHRRVALAERRGEGGGFVYQPYDINHVLTTGQSLSVGATSTPESTTQPYENLMLAQGVMASRGYSEPFVPLVEWTRETMSSAFANHVYLRAKSDLGIRHVGLVSVHGAGGTPYSGLAKGTAPYAQGMDQVKGARDRAALDGKTYVVRAVTCVHGESDSAAANPNYAANLIAWQSDYEADIRAMTGQREPVPMFHTQNSQAATWLGPLQMLDAHVAAPGKVILVGPKYHIPYSDGVHMDASGYKHLAEDYAKAYRRVVLEGRTWEPLRPKSISRVGNVVTVVFHVPEPPIAFDTTLVAAYEDQGFEIVDDAATAPAQPAAGVAPSITGVSIVGSDTVEITLSSAPVAATRLRYGIKYTTTRPSPGGNLRDSDATPSRFGFELYNWAVQFEAKIP